ncbi:MAG: hypothetical protein ABIJ97_02370 [Bacteroidota bacterium]
MKTYYLFLILIFYLTGVSLTSCKKINKVNQDPEIEPIRHGFKTSAAIGYCASLAYTLFNYGNLPDNVIIQSLNINNESGTRTAIMVVSINDSYPIPFNSSVGQITIAGIWGDNGGVITALFTDIDILEAKYEFKGIKTIPVIELEDGKILTLFAEQDIVIGEGSDTTIHLNMTNPQINLEIERLEEYQPSNVFVAVQQNVWFITVNRNNNVSDIYDDEYTINGGGQIAEIAGSSGGMLYHSMISAKFIHSTCELNPVSGVGFIQNLKIGTQTDLGHFFLSFHENCDGKAYVELSSGKYLTSNHKNVNLNFY